MIQLRIILCPALMLAAVTSLPQAAVAQADTVILRSGNPVVGEVESLKRGSLSFDTDEMDVVKIDWDDIAFVASGNFYEVTLVSRQQFFGSLSSPDTALLVIAGVSRSDTVPFREVVQIEAIEKGFWARTNGFIDIGSNIARANQLRSILVNGRFNYRGPNWGVDLNGELYRQRQQSVSSAGDTTTQTTSRSSASLGVSKFLGGTWSVVGSGEVEQNQELELDLRLLGVLGGSYQIVRNQGIEFAVGAGGVVNQERFVDEDKTTSVEALVAAGFDVFDVGDLSLFTTLTTYTNPTDGGRFRVNFDGRIAWDIFGDFTLGFNITERYDSSPPSATAAKRDYQYAFSVGWSW
jgi:hypothetical protein